MKRIVLLDTSVLLNWMRVTGLNQQQAQVEAQFEAWVKAGAVMLLPFAAVLETGNHIAKIKDGNLRRQHGNALLTLVRDSVAGRAPWQPTGLPSLTEFVAWLESFPSHVQRSKSVDKPNEGGSLGDLLIGKDFERICRLNPSADVRIWSLDIDLQAQHQAGTIL